MAPRRHASELNLERQTELSQLERAKGVSRRDSLSKAMETGRSQVGGSQPGCISKPLMEILKQTDAQALPPRDSDVTNLGWGPSTGIKKSPRPRVEIPATWAPSTTITQELIRNAVSRAPP